MLSFEENSNSYLETVEIMLATIHDLPLNNIYVVADGINTYSIIGGCFSPLFNINNVTPENSLVFRLETSKGYDLKRKSESAIKKIKKDVKDVFEQDIINFIFLDFIKAISMTALKKPGMMDEGLQKITKEYGSDIWSTMFDGKSSHLRQVDLAKLLNVDVDTIRRHRSNSTFK